MNVALSIGYLVCLEWPSAKMQSQEDIEKKLSDIEEALKELTADRVHFKTVYESQIYILKWALQ